MLDIIPPGPERHARLTGYEEAYLTDALADAHAEAVTRALSGKARGTGSACLDILRSVAMQASCLASRKFVAASLKLDKKEFVGWFSPFLCPVRLGEEGVGIKMK
jgi:hypothetical protein